jgi:phosphatidylglycerophosphatase A
MMKLASPGLKQPWAAISERFQRMAIKESSDELNPPVIAAELPLPKPARSAQDYLALAISTCGVGYLPLAPGTWGSLVGVAGYLLFEVFCSRVLPFRPLSARNIETFEAIEALAAHTARTVALRTTVLALVVTLLTWVGIWAASRTEKLLGRKDPGKVVIDEVAGQLLTFLLILNPARPWVIVTGFVFFRAFDILKPYPARRLEGLESGLGIMADDIVAGAYAAVATSIIVAVANSQ